MSHYSGHFLTAVRGEQADYFTEPLTIQPGADFSKGKNKTGNILLAGGFPAIHPEAALPLSPTLQLNGDLTDITSESIADLARAEFDRYNSQSYRTYTLESDSRLTVLSNDAKSLHKFIDTYGGVLRIDPILTKEFDSELTTAQDIKIEQRGGGLFLRFNVRKPIDLSRCNYCGDCGANCPENCLSEQLFLDFSRCSLCKECVSACGCEAIDLHVVENRELKTPALLPLEGADVELPDRKENIFSEEDLAALFEQIYAVEVEEIIHWNAAYCQYSVRLGKGCNACAEACDHHAIEQSKAGIMVKHRDCVECGACLSSCPTGALQYERFDDNTFVNYFKSFSFAPGSTVVLGKEAALHEFWWTSNKERYADVFFMEHPQPAALHAMHFLLLVAKGAGRVVILGQDSNSHSKQISISNTIIDELFQKEQAVQVASTPASLITILGQTENSTVISDSYQNYSYTNRRKKLIEIVQFLVQFSDREPQTITGFATEDFGTIFCDEDACTGCIACVGECRISALTTDGTSYSLSHTSALCVQCGICASVCPENALTLQPGFSLHDIFFKERLIAKTEPARCKGCGKIFGTKKSLEKVLSILSAKGMWDKKDDLLSYCDNCRVINLYKTSEHEQANRTD